jgi:hypothetical protein
MSQIPLTNSERVAALGCLGYTEREATFLCLAALHSGYFLRRQYRAFLAQEDGGIVGQLIEKALAREHVSVFTYHHKTQIYHLGARPFYAALGQSDNRNRRRHEPITIKEKVMALDFVLANRDNRYLATEQEKLNYFQNDLGITTGALPGKLYRNVGNGPNTARYFVEKYPVFLSEFVAGDRISPVVSFGFIDDGAVTLSGFETFLNQYRTLFTSLARFEVVYITANTGRCDRARTVFERFATRGANRNPDADSQRLLDHFEARRLYDAKAFSSFDRARLIRMRNERQEFSSPEYDALYELWQRRGSSAVSEKLVPKQSPTPALCGTFSSVVLEHSYDFFGYGGGL